MGLLGRIRGVRWPATIAHLATAIVFLSRPAQPNPLGPADQARTTAPQPKAKGRLFAPQDLGLLEAPDRDQWQKADQIMDTLGIAEGSVVADLGAAGGWFTLQLARRVGPNGLVYAEDIQPAMLEAISRRMQRENLANVRTILGTPSDPRLPSGLDAAVIADAYREMEEPTEPAQIVRLLGNIAASLKPQGRLGIVDWMKGSGGPGPPANQRVDPDAAINAARAAGLRLIAKEEYPPFVLLLVFGRANAHALP
jgi:SAM-dependent methyltransferase